MYVTCFVPLERLMVPISLDTAPPEAFGIDFAVTGGHAWAHAPEHTDLPLLSATQR